MDGFIKEKKIGVAWISTDKDNHKGIALSGKLIEKFISEVNADYDFPRFYAICIYLILKEDIRKIKKIIICNDENFTEVRLYLDLFFSEEKTYSDISILPLTDYCDELGKKKMKSLAHKVANSYRRRGLKPKKWDKGTKLNVVQTSYKELLEIWNDVEKKGRK